MSLLPPDGRIPHSAQTRPGSIFQDSPMVIRRGGRFQILEITIEPDEYPVPSALEDSRSS